MRTSFSPTLEAARRLSAQPFPARSEPAGPTAPAARWCEWPRQSQPAGPRQGIWRALQEIQARHA